MKKIMTIGLCLVLMITLSGCNKQNTPVENKTPPDKVQAFSDTQAPDTPAKNIEETKISISPPSGWEPVAGSVLPVQYLKNTASFMVKKENFSGKTVDDVVKQAKEGFQKVFEKVMYEGETKTITVDSLDARKIVFTCTVSGIQMKYEYVYLFVGENVYAITFGDLANTFDSLSADYEQILKDIRFK